MSEKFELHLLDESISEEAVDLFIETFSGEPWNDVYESRAQVERFFQNHMENNYFLGYVLKEDEAIVALSLGFIKPWIEGLEYYIDQFCVAIKRQGSGIGSVFLNLIESDIKMRGMNGIILNTERTFPSETFYVKNGFKPLDEVVVLVKS